MGKKKRGKRGGRREAVEFEEEEPVLSDTSLSEFEEEEEVEKGGESSNILLDRAVSKVYPSIVTITNYTGDEEQDNNRRWVSGFIFSCTSHPHADTARFVCYILTSAHLFRTLDNENELVPVSKIDICVPTRKSYEGEVVACDLHYNIVVLKIESDVALPTATLIPFTDWASLSPLGVFETSAPPSQYPCRFNFLPGDELIAIHHSSLTSRDVIVCPGKYSVDYIEVGLECDELFRINCRVRNSGGPIVNWEGDVVGVAFDSHSYTAFLPTNIFLNWWKHVKTYREISRPFLGIKVANLFSKWIGFLEPIIHDLNISDGVVVEKVADGSPAASANMRPRDVICQCDGRPVKSCLEFYELLWDKIGKVIEVKGVRDGSHFIWKLEIKAMKTEVLPEIFIKIDSITKKSTKSKAKERLEISEEGESIPSKAGTGKKKRKRKNKTKG